MAHRRFRSSRGSVSGGRRAPTTWSRVQTEAGSIVVPLSTKVLLSTFTLNNVGIGETVRRTIGWLYVQADVGGAVERQAGAFGLVVVSDAAALVGVTAIPGPVTDKDDDGWFVYQSFGVTNNSTAVTTSNTPLWPFESKAMRRIQEGFSVAVMVENASGTHGLAIDFGLSMLTSIS